jgi:transcriptional regulator with XRE-family HTH domain
MPYNRQNEGHPRRGRRHCRWQESLNSIMESGTEQPFVLDINVGQRLRELRAERSLSIRSLADLSGLNFNTLSLIENGKSSPSVSTLQQISTALGIPITAFFETSARKEVIFQKSEQRPRAEFAHGQIEDMGCGLTLGNGIPLLISLKGGADSGTNPMTHTGQEFVFCLEGSIHYSVGKEVYIIEEGDSLIFEAHLPHRWINKNQTTARLMLILCPADDRDNLAEQHFIKDMSGPERVGAEKSG